MFSVEVKTKQTKPNYSFDMKTVIKQLTEKKVVAGFPSGKLNAPHYQHKTGISKEQNEKPLSIIDVAIRNNFGIGVPRREFMKKAAEKWQKFFTESFDKVSQAIEKGTIDADKFLKTLGLKGADYISEAIEETYTPPNSPYTIKMKGSDHPLIDTGDMKNAPRYEIRKAESK